MVKQLQDMGPEEQGAVTDVFTHLLVVKGSDHAAAVPGNSDNGTGDDQEDGKEYLPEESGVFHKQAIWWWRGTGPNIYFSSRIR